MSSTASQIANEGREVAAIAELEEIVGRQRAAFLADSVSHRYRSARRCSERSPGCW